MPRLCRAGRKTDRFASRDLAGRAPYRAAQISRRDFVHRLAKRAHSQRAGARNSFEVGWRPLAQLRRRARVIGISVRYPAYAAWEPSTCWSDRPTSSVQQVPTSEVGCSDGLQRDQRPRRSAGKSDGGATVRGRFWGGAVIHSTAV